MKKATLFLLSLLFIGVSWGQAKIKHTKKNKKDKSYLPTKKGAVFGYWGWNRAMYTVSNIHFRGDGYRFTLYDVVAHDRQTPVRFDPYLNPVKLTIPQTNYRIGYFIKDNLGIVLSIDHMKYVMNQDQVVHFSGLISDPKYAAMVHKGKVDLSSSDFLTFEHTDGLNYISVAIEKYQSIYSINWFDVEWAYGAGFGMLMPKSNIKLFGNKRSDRYHIAGFGLDGHVNLNLIFWKHIMLRAEFKAGYIGMPSIMTTLHNKPDRASQHFGFIQLNFGIGYIFQTIH